MESEYTVIYTRVYDQSDWDSAEYLEVHYPIEECPNDGLLQEGGRVIGGKDIIEGRDFHITWMGVVIVPDRTKRILEAEELAGLSFEPVHVEPKSGNPFNADRPPRKMPIAGMPFWEIVPAIKLPPLSPTMQLTDIKRNPMPPGDESAHYKVTEGPYNHAELHFRRADMADMPPFDVARTRENFMITPRTIFSKRFYHHCQANGLEARWAPVRIDE